MAAKKTVPVTSVTPKAKVTATSKAQQARTRNLVMGIASVTPVGRIAKTIKTEATMAKAGFNAAAKTSVRKQVARDAFAKKNPGKLMEPKSAVKVKPAAKQVGNPRNDVKARENYYSSISRGGAGAGPAGKAKDTRVHFSKKPTGNKAK
jgi:hypothetical protein